MKLGNTELEKEATQTAVSSSPKIYIVEDDIFYNKVVTYSLVGSNFDVKSFTNGNDYLKAIRNSKPDLVIMDYNLGDVTGLELMEKTRSISSSIKVVMISAQEKLDEATGILKRGAEACILKDKMIFPKLKVLARKAAIDMENRKKHKRSLLFKSVFIGGIALLILIYFFLTL